MPGNTGVAQAETPAACSYCLHPISEDRRARYPNVRYCCRRCSNAERSLTYLVAKRETMRTASPEVLRAWQTLARDDEEFL